MRVVAASFPARRSGAMMWRQGAMSEPNQPGPPVTRILRRAAGGDHEAAAELLPLVYDELRQLAAARLRREHGRGGGSPTLQATALVHEAWLRLAADASMPWNGRGHFFGAAAQAMRRILVDRARARAADKRGGEARRIDVDVDEFGSEPDPDVMLAIDDALQRLAAKDAQLAEIVQLRWLCGLSIEEVAETTGLTPAQVKGRWQFGRAWLHHDLRPLDPGRADGGDS